MSDERWCVEKLHKTKCVKSLFYRVNSRLQLRIRCSKRYSAIIENKSLIQSNLLQRSLFMSWRTIRTFYSNFNLSTTITVKVARARLNWQNNLSNDDKSTFRYWKRSRKLISTKRRSSLFLFHWCILIVSHIYMQQYTLNVRFRGKQLVLFSRESWCFPRRSGGKHQDSRENKTD